MLSLTFLIILTLITKVQNLAGQTVASYCHCDITANFCDLNCCCDLSCTSVVSNDCYNSKSNSYCPDPTFFARMGSSFLNSAGCFYYNSTNTILEEVSLTNSQISKITNNVNNFARLAASSPAVKSGYQMGDSMTVSGKSSFTFLTTSGQCITTATIGVTSFQMKFGVNMNLFCSSTNTSLVPLIYSSFSGQKLSQFSSDTTSTLTIPTFDDPSITSVTLQIIIGKYGSNNAKYIQRVVLTTSTAASTQRNLKIVFVQPSKLTQNSFSPTFFPQIPSDMFYPIYLIS